MKSSHGLKISFCTTCRGAEYLERLKQTLPENLKNNTGAGNHDNVEFVIVAYGDAKVTDWLKENYASEIKSGLIRAVDLPLDQAEYFKMAHAKNIAHRMATGDVLCNLDCDNITGQNFSGFLNETFSENRNVVVCATTRDKLLRKLETGKTPSQITGRVAISRDMFERLHGYDETRNAAKDGDDTNLKERAYACGVTQVSLPTSQYGHIIPHSNEARVANMSPQDRDKSTSNFQRGNSLLTRIGTVKRVLLGEQSAISRHLVGANPEGNYGCAQVTLMDSNLAPQRCSLTPSPHPSWQAQYKISYPPMDTQAQGMPSR